MNESEMNEEEKKWLTIIPSLPEKEFTILLEHWREENKSVLESIDITLFVLDVIRTTDGDYRRLRMQLNVKQ